MVHQHHNHFCNGEEDENYLPDLPDEKSQEQLIFDQKVFRCNEAFVKK